MGIAMEQAEFINLMQHAEREIDAALLILVGLNNRKIIPVIVIKCATDRLYDLSLELNTRIDHLKIEMI
jgi:hypothetical protein